MDHLPQKSSFYSKMIINKTQKICKHLNPIWCYLIKVKKKEKRSKDLMSFKIYHWIAINIVYIPLYNQYYVKGETPAMKRTLKHNI